MSSASRSQSVEISLDHQLVAGGFAFQPQLVARAAEERGVTGFHGLAERLVVHKADHEDAARGVILNDGRDQAVEFAEIEIHVSIPIKKPAKLSAGSCSLQKFVRLPPIARDADDGGDGRNA